MLLQSCIINKRRRAATKLYFEVLLLACLFMYRIKIEKKLAKNVKQLVPNEIKVF